MDLPDTAPTGVEWSPFLTGFPFADHFILARTMLDQTAPRAGMVFSHALFLPLDEFVKAPGLQTFIEALWTAPRKREAIGARDITPACDPARAAPKDLASIANLLMGKGDGPVVCLGHEGFDDVIRALWANLSHELRRGLSFRLSFGPTDLVEEPKPAIVCTPKALASRWRIERTIDPHSNERIGSLSAALLIGDPSGRPIEEFAHRIGAEVTKFSELRLLESAYRLHSSSQVSELAACLRLVDKLSPNPDHGADEKSSILDRLKLALPKATAEEILALRNLSLTSFASSARFWNAVQESVAHNSYLADQDSDLLVIVDTALGGGDAIDEWRKSVAAGVITAFDVGDAVVRGLWRWARSDLSILSRMIDKLPANTAIEERLIRCGPEQPIRDLATGIMALCVQCNWLRLHGWTAASALSPNDAVCAQVAVDHDLGYLDGLSAALRKAQPNEILRIAISLDDQRLTQIAGKCAAQHREIVVDLDLSVPISRKIWLAILASDPAAWDVTIDPVKSFHRVLDALLAGSPEAMSLVGALADSPLADIFTYSRRSEVWPKLASSAQAKLLRATARTWLASVARGDPVDEIETILQDVVLDDGLESTLESLITTSLSRALRVIGLFQHFGETRFARFVRTVLRKRRSIPAPEAEAIGIMLSQTRWQGPVDDIVRAVIGGRDDLKPTLRACADMVGILTRIRLDIKPLSSGEKWKLLEDTAAELYPRGPDEQGVWERAGGADADLLHNETGSGRWHDALQKVRFGSKVRSNKLLRQMLVDYPNNDVLAYLADDFEFKY
jgi:hypothetical protein